jgi:hypothetical protein
MNPLDPKNPSILIRYPLLDKKKLDRFQIIFATNINPSISPLHHSDGKFGFFYNGWPFAIDVLHLPNRA